MRRVARWLFTRCSAVSLLGAAFFVGCRSGAPAEQSVPRPAATATTQRPDRGSMAGLDAVRATSAPARLSDDEFRAVLASVESVESRYERKRQAFLAEGGLAPASTPYDDADPDLRRVYLDGYRDAFLHYTAYEHLSGAGSWGDGILIPNNEETRARASGSDAGASAAARKCLLWMQDSLKEYEDEAMLRLRHFRERQ